MEANNAQALEPHKRVESFFAETVLKTKESVYTWTIKNLSHFHKKDTNIDSPIFTTELEEDLHMDWNLTFYPDGEESADDGYASLQFNKIDYAEAVSLYVKVSTLVKNEEIFQEEVQYESYIEFLDDDQDHYVIENFLEKETLPRFLHNGNFAIRCRVYSCLATSESEAPETPIARVENQTIVDRRMRELEDFGNLFENEKFSDVTLAVGEEKFPAHKNVLSARSRVFAAMFEHNMKENKENLVTIVDVEGVVMREVLRFVYSAKVNNLEALAQKLLTAADKYELDGLKLVCEEVLIEKLSDKTVGDILLLVDRHETEKLRSATLEFITIHASELASVASFNEAIKALSPLLVSTVVKTLMLKM